MSPERATGVEGYPFLLYGGGGVIGVVDAASFVVHLKRHAPQWVRHADCLPNMVNVSGLQLLRQSFLLKNVGTDFSAGIMGYMYRVTSIGQLRYDVIAQKL